MYQNDLNPFDGLKVVELASVLAGPAVGMFFAEMGAEVIKIENKNTGGDVTRSWKHPEENSDSSGSAYYNSVNWNKVSILLDLQNENDRQEALEYIKQADIVISNFRKSSAEKLGFSYEKLQSIKSDIILGSINAYGKDDDRAGFDALLQAETGWMHLNGSEDSPPTKMPVALIDVLAAHQLKEGLLVALIKKMKTGHGSHVSVSLYETAVASLMNQSSNHLNIGINPKRKGSLHPNIAPYGEIIESKDGDLILLAVGNDKQFTNLCDLLEVSHLKNNMRFQSNKSRVENRKALHEFLNQAAQRMEATAILEKALELSVPLGRINDLKTVFENEKAQSLILEDRTGKRVRTTVFKIDD